MIRQWVAALLAVALFLWAIGAFDPAPGCMTDTECAQRFGGDGGPGSRPAPFWR